MANLRFTKSRRGEPRRDGCGFLLLTCVFTCFLLALNCVAVARLFPLFADAGPALFRDARVQQVTMFIAPVVMVFCEWWVVDLIVELVTPRPRS